MDASGIKLTSDDLEDRIQAADPRAYLVLPRVLKRVIRLDRELSGFFVSIPHIRSLVIERDRVLTMVRRDELGIGATEVLPETVILIARPKASSLAKNPIEASLVRSWRRLFHALVHAEMEAPSMRRRLTQAAVRERVDLIGQTAFDEIRAVLQREGLLLPPLNDRNVYCEFAAVFLELKFFTPHVLGRYFPGSREPDRLEAILRRDLDVDGLLEKSRLRGCPSLQEAARILRPTLSRPRAPVLTREEREREKKRVPSILGRAGKMAALGNRARAAILRTRAALLSEGGAARSAHDAALADLDRLVERLISPLQLSPHQSAEWRAALAPLLPLAASDDYTAEARLLLDLQKVCVNHERGVHAVSLLRYVLSRGREPLKRRLPHQQQVLVTRHLHRASARLRRVSLDEEARAAIEAPLEAALVRANRRLRMTFRPILEGVFNDVGLEPRTAAKRVARDKLVSALLDRLVARGHMNMGQVRDALSQNNLKLPDVENARAWWHRDPLLRVNALLAERMDGVYHPGEIYLRGLQHVSAGLFGTRIGRAITRHGILPFGGAFMIVEGLHHTLGVLLEKIAHVEWPFHGAAYVLPVGVWLLAFMNLEFVRESTITVFSTLWRVVRLLFVDLTWRLLALPIYKSLMLGAIPRLLWRFLLKPGLLTLLFITLLWATGSDGPTLRFAAVLTFLGLEAFFLTRLGSNIEEISADWATEGWKQIRNRLALGFVRFVLDVFQRVLEWFERGLYAVDEWLRFRTGESRVTLWMKAVLGTVWFGLAYVVRIYVTLLLEPQINPIKHFPVVTVSHKFILPFTVELTALFSAPLRIPLGPVVANTVALSTVVLLPGVFGFLVWEFKENWRLFEKNRSRTLRPVTIGSHGESMLRFMKPGFHSGTLPKAYRKLARAELKGTGRVPFFGGPAKHKETLHHVASDIRHFVDRELVRRLGESRRFGGLPLRTQDVVTGSNCIRIPLECDALDGGPVIVSFEEQSGWLVAGIPEAGWIPSLSDRQQAALSDALFGLYHLSGVRLVREQLRALIGDETYDICDRGLVVWPGEGFESEVVYSLSGKGPMIPVSLAASLPYELPTLDRRDVLLSLQPLTFADWERCWEDDYLGRAVMPLTEGLTLLPTDTEIASPKPRIRLVDDEASTDGSSVPENTP